MELNIYHIYPDLLNLYGDRGNIVCLKHRLEKRGIDVNVKEVRTVNVHRKAKRLQRYEGFKPAYKKAIVKLAPGQTISVFEV